MLCVEDGHVVFQQELPLGTASLARQWMHHTPPTPLDIEHAIEVTEDVLMPLAAKLARTEQLQLSGSGAALILQGVGVAPECVHASLESERWKACSTASPWSAKVGRSAMRRGLRRRSFMRQW